jgi:hypothetical protein
VVDTESQEIMMEDKEEVIPVSTVTKMVICLEIALNPRKKEDHQETPQNVIIVTKMVICLEIALNLKKKEDSQENLQNVLIVMKRVMYLGIVLSQEILQEVEEEVVVVEVDFDPLIILDLLQTIMVLLGQVLIQVLGDHLPIMLKATLADGDIQTRLKPILVLGDHLPIMLKATLADGHLQTRLKPILADGDPLQTRPITTQEVGDHLLIKLKHLIRLKAILVDGDLPIRLILVVW